MHPHERDVLPKRGPHFWRDGGDVMFKFVVDITNVIGPRKATESDKRKHPEAWAQFQQSEPMHVPVEFDEVQSEPVKRGPGRPRKVASA